jgi:hypothetical protein
MWPHFISSDSMWSCWCLKRKSISYKTSKIIENVCLKKNMSICLFIFLKYLACIIILLIVEFVSVSLLYSFKHKIMEHANVIFEDLIHNYADDDDIRIIVDTIQSNVSLLSANLLKIDVFQYK